MRGSLRIVFLLLALGANAALAQQSIVYTVEGRGGKTPANSFQWGVTATNTPAMGAGGGGSGKVTLLDTSLTIPVGEGAVQFAQWAMRGENLRSVLVEFPTRGQRPSDPAPFAIRLTEVVVTSVTLGKSGDGGSGTAEVKLKAAKIELYSSSQDPTGKMLGSAKAGFDTKANRAF
jgi:type VI protein secretion system component Hcp